jgi:hypothetical protein
VLDKDHWLDRHRRGRPDGRRMLAAGTYSVQWYDVTTRKTARAAKVKVGSPGSVRFTAPFAAA